MIGLGDMGLETIQGVGEILCGGYDPTWKKQVAFLGIHAQEEKLRSIRHIPSSVGVCIRKWEDASCADYTPPAWHRMVGVGKDIQNTELTVSDPERCRFRAKLKCYDQKTYQMGVDQEIVARIREAMGPVQYDAGAIAEIVVWVIGCSADGVGRGLFTEMPALIDRAFHGRKVGLGGILYLSNTVTNQNTLNPELLEAVGYATLKELDYYQGVTMREGDELIFPTNDKPYEYRGISFAKGFYDWPVLIGAVDGTRGNDKTRAEETAVKYVLQLLTEEKIKLLLKEVIKNIRDYVLEEGPGAFYNLYRGNFEEYGSGIDLMLQILINSKDMKTGEDYRWTEPETAEGNLNQCRLEIMKMPGGILSAFGDKEALGLSLRGWRSQYLIGESEGFAQF